MQNLEQNLGQMQEIVKNCQVTLERHRMENEDQASANYSNQKQEFAQSFRV